MRTAPTGTRAGPGPPGSTRLPGLDAFRGFTIAAMVLVNNVGNPRATHEQFLHAPWHGWTFADTVFPAFLFIMGVALTLSFAKRAAGGGGRWQLHLHIARRAIILFAIGILLNGFPGYQWEIIRIPGVLQRIALCYLAASLLVLHCRLRAQVAWTIALLAGYWLLMEFVPVPGVDAGSYEPGENLAAFIDYALLHGHLYHRSLTWDPEGVLGTLPAIATTMAGCLAGHLLRNGALSGAGKAAYLLAAGIGLMAAGALLDFWHPINKNLWTSSFAIFMSGIAAAAFAVCHWLIDVRGWQRFAQPAVMLGVNAIVIYVLSEIASRVLLMIDWNSPDGVYWTMRTKIYYELFASWLDHPEASLAFATAFVLGMLVTAWVLWRLKWFVRI